MPIFEFKCPKCGAQAEAIIKENRRLVCSCGSEMQKQVGKCNFELKGKGWFKDGYSS